jgi:hypothetical protein
MIYTRILHIAICACFFASFYVLRWQRKIYVANVKRWYNTIYVLYVYWHDTCNMYNQLGDINNQRLDDTMNNETKKLHTQLDEITRRYRNKRYSNVNAMIGDIMHVCKLCARDATIYAKRIQIKCDKLS